MTADRWGVAYGYQDADGAAHISPEATRLAIRAALGAPQDPDAPPPSSGAIVISVGDDWSCDQHSELRTESGDTHILDHGDPVPDGTPTGYHELVDSETGDTRRFIVAPTACHLPDDLFGWGWATQLYAMRSRNSWGIGDLADLTTLNSWSAERGARFTLINPLHAATPTDGQQPSPYFPTSRIWRNPLYLHIEDVPGWSDVAEELAPIAIAATAMLDDRRIDRDLVRVRKMAALERLWGQWRMRRALDPEASAFAHWRASEGAAIERFAVYCTLVERHGGDTRDWPHDLRSASGPGVDAMAAAEADRVSFHAWIQWLIELQLGVANDALAVMTDLAIGVDRAGADAWVWPEAFSLAMSVGAPPDTFNTQGQNWGLPPFNPWRLRDAGYEPFIRTVRSAFRHAGAVRMDHVMGLFRLWWIPEGAAPTEGCYVYLPFKDLLGILALESQRAQAPVVGEDLGTVEDYVRVELSARRVLSYKLTQFETVPASQLPMESMAAITTHDLPTIAGIWTGTDLVEAAAVGSRPFTRGTAAVRASLAERAGTPLESGVDPVDDLLSPLADHERAMLSDLLGLGIDETLDVPPYSVAEIAQRRGLAVDDVIATLERIPAELSTAHAAGVDPLIRALHTELATAPSRLISATLDDALAVQERPNLPGTVDERPNWRIALPVLLEDILSAERTAAIAASLQRLNPS